MISVFIDTNMLFSRSTDFSQARFYEKIQEITSEIEVNDLYANVKLVIPQIVIDELFQQQKEEYMEAVTKIKKYKIPNVNISFPDDYEACCQTLFTEVIDLMKRGMVNVDIAPYPPDEALKNLIVKVINKYPPFEGKEKQTDKGFKDALIWESLIAYKKTHLDSNIVLYSKDVRLTDKQLEIEFETLFNEKITMVKRENPNSHDELLSVLRNFENKKEKSQSFVQELKNQLVGELMDIPLGYIIDNNNKLEIENQTWVVKDGSVSNIVIQNVQDEEDVIRFDVQISINLNCCAECDEFMSVSYEANAIVIYQISNSKFFLKGCDDFYGNFYEYSGHGIDL